MLEELSLAEFARLPFTRPQDLRHRTSEFLCVSQSEISRTVTLRSSGTSGEPKRIFFTPEDQELTSDFFHVGMSMLAKPGDTVLIGMPSNVPGSVGQLLADAIRKLGARPLLWEIDKGCDAALKTSLEERVNCIVGLPVWTLALARKSVLDRFPLSTIRSVLLCSDHVPSSVVAAIKQAWACEVFEHYGMTEMGYGGGVDCKAHGGYHLREADLFFEVVDPDTRRPVKAGKCGEVVFTTLTRKGMPLIRYRTGDISRFIPGRCPCGSVLRRLDRVRTRLEGRAFVGLDSPLTMSMLDEILFSIPAVKDFRAQLLRGPATTLEITAALTNEIGLTTGTALSTIRHALNSIEVIRKAQEWPGLNVTVRIVPELTMTKGKRTIEERSA